MNTSRCNDKILLAFFLFKNKSNLKFLNLIFHSNTAEYVVYVENKCFHCVAYVKHGKVEIVFCVK